MKSNYSRLKILAFIAISLCSAITSFAQYSGTYTVQAAGDFNTISEAIDSLESQGVSSSVTISIGSGTYNEQLSIGTIAGVSASNTVTFTSSSGDRNDVVITYAASSSGSNYVLNLNKTSYLSFEDLTIKSTGATYKTVVLLTDTVTYFTIDNCLLESPVTGYNAGRGVNALSTLDTNISVLNSTLKNCSYGVYAQPGSLGRHKNWEVENDSFLNNYSSSVYVNSAINVELTKNYVFSNLSSGTKGFEFSSSKGDIKISKNTIFLDQGNHGILLQGITEPCEISNNMVTMDGTTNIYGIYVDNCDTTKIYHNSVLNTIAGTYTTSNTCLYIGTPTLALVKNNSFFNQGSGLAYRVQAASNLIESDYNNIYSSGANTARINVTDYSSLGDFISTTGEDANSLSVNPRYTSIADLHTSYGHLDNAGITLSSVTTDIDNGARANPPCIGADEYVGTTIDKLKGIYTIDSSGSGSRNFTSFSNAAYALDSAGIDSNVVFNIASGTYNDQLSIGQIYGSSASNNIEFRSASGNREDVLLQYSASSASDNWVLSLNGTDNISIRLFTVKSLGSTYTQTIVITGGAKNAALDSMLIESPITTSTAAYKSCVYMATHGDSNIVISSSKITGGSYSIYHTGNSTVYSKQFKIINDSLLDFSGAAVRTQYAEAIEISTNYFYSNTNSSAYGINMLNCKGRNKVNKNTIVLDKAYYGISMSTVTSYPNERPEIINNMISILDNGTSNGIYIYDSDTINIFHNSILVTSTSTTSACIVVGAYSLVNVKNNSFLNDGAGLAVSIHSISVIVDSDYNNYYSKGIYLAKASVVNFEDLDGIKAASPFDDNSISVNPYYTSSTDLRTAYGYLDNAGTAVLQVTDDIDGNARNNPPCIGALEFTGTTINPLKGNYTIDSSGSGTRNFISFSNAVNALDSAGIDSSVCFTVASGTYNDQVTQSFVNGSSTVNTITFKSATGDRNDVIIQNEGTSTSNWVWKVNNTKNLNLKGLTIKNTNETYSRVLHLNGTVENFLGDSCLFLSNGGSGVNSIGIYGSTTNDSNIVISNSSIKYSGYGIYLYASNSKNWQILNDSILSFRTSGVYGYNSSSLTIAQSFISTDVNSSAYGMQLSSMAGKNNIRDNTVAMELGYYGISLYNFTSAGSDSTLVYNNMVSLYDNGTSHGIYLNNCDTINIAHNSVYINSIASSTNTCLYLSSNSKANLFSNSLYSSGIGLSLIADGSSIVGSDYNNLKSNGVNVVKRNGTFYPSFEDYQFAGYESNSISVNPYYISDINLRSNYGYLDNAGTSIAYASTDIDGSTRNNPPCIGVNEFIVTPIIPLNGTYTIDSSGSGANNFLSFTDAFKALDSLGIDAAVTFNVATGTYYDRIKIKEIIGASSSRTITFTSESGDKEDVILTNAHTGTTDNYLIEFTNSKYFIFKNMTFSTLDDVSSTYLTAFSLKGNMRFFTLDSCAISAEISSSSGSYRTLVTGTLSKDSLIHITNCTFTKGAKAIALTTSGGGHCLVADNSFVNQGNSATSLSGYEYPLVQNNDISSSMFYSSGIVLDFVSSDFVTVKNNKIVANTAGYGLRFSDCDASSSKPSLIYNNMVSAGTATYGMYIGNSKFVGVYHNNVLLNKASGSYVFYASGSNDDSLKIVNNNFIHSNIYPAIKFNTTNFIQDCDYNNYYTTGTNLGEISSTQYTTLAAWQTGTSLDGSTLNVDPNYTSTSDLHVATTDLYNAGDNAIKSIVTKDFDGELRTVANPCIGADEFTPSFSNDFGVTQLISPKTECGLTTVTVTVEFTNHGNSSVDSIPVYYQLNGGAVVNDTIFSTVGPNTSVDFDFAQTIDVSALSNYTFKTYTGQSGDVNSANDTFSATLNNYSTWSHSVTNDTAVCNGSYVLLDAIGGTNFIWSTGQTSSSINRYVNQNKTYYVTIINALGCEKYDSIKVTSKSKPSLGYTNESGYSGSFVEPQVGPSSTDFEFRVTYTDVDNKPPSSAPLLLVDANNNYAFEDLSDLSFSMSEVDPTDTLYSDGKIYSATENLSANENYHVRIQATNTNGCDVLSGYRSEPLSDDDLVDLRIWANNISFDDWNPDPNQNVTVSTVIYNTANYDADSFLVSFYVDDSLIETRLTDGVLSNSQLTMSFNYTFDEDGFYPIKVVVDTSDLIEESNELNNFAIRPVIVGDFDIGADIVVNAGFVSDTVYAGHTVSYTGKAHYTGTNSPDTICQGAFIELEDSEGLTQTSFTNSTGNISINFKAPQVVGMYVFDGSITDYTLTDQFGPDTFWVIPKPDNPYNLKVYVELDSSKIVIGDSCDVYGYITNTGTDTMKNFKAKYWTSNCTGNSFDSTFASMAPGDTFTINDRVIFNSLGIATVTIYGDYSHVYSEITEADNYAYDNATVLPDKPDITPSIYRRTTNNLNQDYILQYSFQNLGGMPTGKFYYQVKDSSGGASTVIKYDSIDNIERCMHTSTITDTVQFASLNCHSLYVEADVPVSGNGIVDEYREDNNTDIITLCHALSPDLFTASGHINVEPINPINADTIFLTNKYYNCGNDSIPSTDTVSINFELTTFDGSGDTVYRNLDLNGMLAKASNTTLIQIEKPAYGNNLIKVVLDDSSRIAESNELNNTAQIPLCWDFTIHHQSITSSINGIHYVGDLINGTYGVFNKGLYTGTDVKVKIIVDDSIELEIDNFPAIYPTGRNYKDVGSFNLPYIGGWQYAFATPGEHEVKYIVDYDSVYSECSETNNVDSVIIIIADQQSDLVIRSHHIAPGDLNPENGDSVAIYLNYENQGKLTTDSFSVVCKVNDVQVGAEVEVPALRPGRDTTIAVTEKWFTIGGVSVIRGYVDFHDSISESDELNNIASRAIVGGKDNGTNLQVYSIDYTDGDPCNSKTPVSVSVKITNEGRVDNNADVGLYAYAQLNGDTLVVPLGVLGIIQNTDFDSGDTVAVDFQAAIPLNITANTQISSLYIVALVGNADVQEYNELDNVLKDTACETLFLSNITENDVKCSGTNTGSIFVSLTNGTAPFTVSMSTYDTSTFAQTTFYINSEVLFRRDTFNGVPSGHFIVSVASNGSNVPLLDTIFVGSPEPLMVSGVSNTSGCAGGIDVTITGGTPCEAIFGSQTVEYYGQLWVAKDTNTLIPNPGYEDLERVPSGDYYLFIQDCNLCPIIDTFTVSFDLDTLSNETSGSPCSYRDTTNWTYLLNSTNSGLISGIYDVHPDSTTGRIAVDTLNPTLTSKDRHFVSRVVQMETTDTVGTDSFDVRLYYTFEEIDSLIAQNDSISSLDDIVVHKYSGSNQNTFLGDNSVDSGDWTRYVPMIDTVNNSICFQVKVPGFSEFYISDTSSQPLGGGVILNAKIFLSGAYNSGSQLMHDSLRSQSLLPNIDPYQADVKYTMVGEDQNLESQSVLQDLGDKSAVDWIFIELRDKSDSVTVVAARSALLLRDGTIVDTDGTSYVRFTNVDADDYFVVIKHRNHLGVMTESAISLSSDAGSLIDFSDASGVGLYGADATNSSGGARVLWAGDASDDGSIKYNGSGNDKNTMLFEVGLANPNTPKAGYLKADVNMDGVVKYNGSGNDKNVTLFSVGLANPNVPVTEQIK